MPRPKIEPHLHRLLIDEKTMIGSLFQVDKTERYYCSMMAPAETVSDMMADGHCYGYGEGSTPDDAVHAARQKLWNGL